MILEVVDNSANGIDLKKGNNIIVNVPEKDV